MINPLVYVYAAIIGVACLVLGMVLSFFGKKRNVLTLASWLLLAGVVLLIVAALLFGYELFDYARHAPPYLGE